MKILYISPYSPLESVGGVERYISNLIKYYKNRSEHKIYLVLPTINKSRIEKEGNVIIYLDNNFSIPQQVKLNQKIIAKNAHLFSKNLESLVVKNKIDVICAENLMFGPPAIYSLLINMIASNHNIPIVLRLHSFAVTQLQVELINQLVWSKVSCVSQSVAGDCFQKGTDVDVISTHYLGVNTQEFNDKFNFTPLLREQLSIGENAKIILTATRIIRGTRNILQEKGVVNLIRAFSKIAPRYPNLYLLIAVNEFHGSYEMLLGYIKLYGIEKQTIVKTYKLDEMPTVYRESDIFILPSENETFGQVFIEAMSCGIPVIGTKVGGIPEIISDSYNGYLVVPDDASILAQKIENLLIDKKIKDKFIKTGIKTVQRSFTLENQFPAFHKMLEEVIQNNSRNDKNKF